MSPERWKVWPLTAEGEQTARRRYQTLTGAAYDAEACAAHLPGGCSFAVRQVTLRRVPSRQGWDMTLVLRRLRKDATELDVRDLELATG